MGTVGLMSSKPGPPLPEPLRDLHKVTALRVSAARGPAMLLRSGLVDRLLVAQTLLPRAVRLLVIAAHHPPTVTTPCPNAPAHGTGAAVDLSAYVHGYPEPSPWTASPPPDWPLVRTALTTIGMVNTTAWWHWSYGDPDWASSHG